MVSGAALELAILTNRWKKTVGLCALGVAMAATALGQESRQEISLSGVGNFTPQVNGKGSQITTDLALGALASYRFMLTPRSALELNFTFSQYQSHLVNTGAKQYEVHTRQMEGSTAYVYSRNYHNYNPFVEAGVGAMMFQPIKDYATTSLDAKTNIALGGLFGGGLAYEISPSFDIRATYRGFIVKTPNFKLDGSNFDTGRYELVSMPALGVAYHF